MLSHSASAGRVQALEGSEENDGEDRITLDLDPKRNARVLNAAQHPYWHSMEDRSQHGTQQRSALLGNKQADMTPMFAGVKTVRSQGLFLIPVGQENTHQQTIDGLLPADVVPSASTSALLPCWGVTDGNYLVKNKVRAQAGDIFALIRAQHKKRATGVCSSACCGGETYARSSSLC